MYEIQSKPRHALALIRQNNIRHSLVDLQPLSSYVPMVANPVCCGKYKVDIYELMKDNKYNFVF